MRCSGRWTTTSVRTTSGVPPGSVVPCLQQFRPLIRGPGWPRRPTRRGARQTASPPRSAAQLDNRPPRIGHLVPCHRPTKRTTAAIARPAGTPPGSDQLRMSGQIFQQRFHQRAWASIPKLGLHEWAAFSRYAMGRRRFLDAQTRINHGDQLPVDLARSWYSAGSPLTPTACQRDSLRRRMRRGHLTGIMSPPSRRRWHPATAARLDPRDPFHRSAAVVH